MLFSREDLKRLIMPLVLEQILAVTIGMADTVMVSYAGEAAVSGVSLVDMVNVLIINLFSALATGGAVITSQLIGANRRDRGGGIRISVDAGNNPAFLPLSRGSADLKAPCPSPFFRQH